MVSMYAADQGPPLTNSGGVPWTAAYIDSIGDPTCDLRSNIAAEARAKIVYERLISLTDDPGVKEALGFLMTREIAHQQSFEKALYSIQNNFPPGKLAGIKPFDNVYFNMSVGDGDMRGPWNNHGTFDYREAQPAVDGGDGQPMVRMDADSAKVVQQSATRLMSDPQSDPTTGAMLGADPSRVDPTPSGGGKTAAGRRRGTSGSGTGAL